MGYKSLSDFIQLKSDLLKEKTALKVRDNQSGKWISISWKVFSEKITDTAYALCNKGIKEFSNVGVYMQNMAECFYIDFACFANRAVSIPMYATSSIDQIKHIIDEAEISTIFVGEQFQYDNAYSVQKTSVYLKQIIIVDKLVVKSTGDTSSVYFDEFISGNITKEVKQQVKQRTADISEDDIVHILYTSGTTGSSKGVILKHSNYLDAFKIHDIRLGYLPKGFTSMCFLPLTHIFEKAWSLLCLHWDCVLAINLDPRQIQDTILEVRPNAMSSVPRFWEKVYAGVQEKIENMSPLLKKIVADAIETGRIHNLEYRNNNKKVPLWTRLKFNFYNQTVFNLLRKKIGIEHGIVFPCAGAALSDKINTFVQSVNIPLVYGYGLTETTATVSCFAPEGFEIGTVGKVMPHVDVKIGEGNEILVKGKTVMHGYYKRPEETAKAFTEDGFFKTGDAGYLTERNEIILTERIKDMYKTSNGKYIAPQQLESCLSADKYIDVVAVIGEQRKYVSALIVPVFEELIAYAKDHKIDFSNLIDLCRNQEIKDMIWVRIYDLQKHFADYEKIKKFTLIPAAFSIEGGEFTNTLKLKRAFISRKYEQIIDSMYQ